MWTWVDGAEEIVVDGGFAAGDAVVWPVLSSDFTALLPQIPDGFADEILSAVDESGDAVVAGTITRIVMVTGRRRTSASEITATPVEHVQVLDMAGFLVQLDPDD